MKRILLICAIALTGTVFAQTEKSHNSEAMQKLNAELEKMEKEIAAALSRACDESL